MGALVTAPARHRAQRAAQQFIDKYFARYPGVAEYMQQTRESRAPKAIIETVFGRRLADRHQRRQRPRRAGAERAAINAPMQGTAADLIKLAMIAVDDWLHGSACSRPKLIMQVHDELVLEVPQTELDLVKRVLPER